MIVVICGTDIIGCGMVFMRDFCKGKCAVCVVRYNIDILGSVRVLIRDFC
jgi:hypothetical protein